MVGVAGHSRIEEVRIAKPKPHILPKGLRLAARAVRNQIGIDVRIYGRSWIVIQSRKRTPRHALILLCVGATTSYLSCESGACEQRQDGDS